MVKNVSQCLLATFLWAGVSAAAAQAVPAQAPANVLQLSSSASVEVAQDVLIVTLAAVRQGGDARTVQTQLQQVLDAALAIARRQAQPGLLELRTGHFGLYPQQGKDGKVSGWQGRTELVLQGRDLERITRTAAQIEGMTVSQTGFSLSREAREKAQGQAQSEAIASFQTKALSLTRDLGLARYTLREVSVSGDDMPFAPRSAMLASKGMAADAAPIPVEPGKAQVVVNVTGTVQMHP